jgi:CheY-like chemotaxis protein
MAVKVLVADDEETILKLLATALEREKGYHVLLAKDGEEALEIVHREKPQVILLDIWMPKMNGYEVCRAIKSNPATLHTKVIFVTGLVEESCRAMAFRVGADDYITKPFTIGMLLKKLEYCWPHTLQASVP